MRHLILLSGIPGSGKSTWIRENGYEPYTLSSDAIRLMYSSIELGIDGKLGIPQNDNKDVWNLLFTLLERRMQKGVTTFVDATHVKIGDINKYKKLAEMYRYRVWCVDFDVSISVAKNRNEQREGHKVVPDHVLHRMHNSYQQRGKLSSWITCTTPEKFDNEFFKIRMPRDLDDYKKVHVIGDIHGCYDALKEYIGDIHDDQFYVFLGDYVDRGIQNKEVMEYLISIKDKSNVIFLEGNHEIWLHNWSTNQQIRSHEFLNRTAHQIEDIPKKEIRSFVNRLYTFFWFSFNGEQYLCSHGGISNIPYRNNLKFELIPAHQFIKGVGTYGDNLDVYKTWFQETSTIQFHGHRNVHNSPIKVNPICYNLEGKVEHGGYLRCIQISMDGVKEKETKNNVYRETKKPIANIAEFVELLRADPGVRENKLPDNISSFNFKKDVFYGRKWNDITTKARGLFINTNTNEIVARSYDKFFNIGEFEHLTIDTLETNLNYPIKVVPKYNGFLGILGYNSETDSLVFASKSSTQSDYASYFKNIFVLQYQNDQEKIKSFLKERKVSMVFEVIDPINDPHIIQYINQRVVLLDIICNTTKFQKSTFNPPIRMTKAKTYKILRNQKDFREFYNYCINTSKKKEGYVLEDMKGFQTKIKLPYYNFWKLMRTMKDSELAMREKGRPNDKCVNKYGPASFGDITGFSFYDYIKSLSLDELRKDIVLIRKKFMVLHHQRKNIA